MVRVSDLFEGLKKANREMNLVEDRHNHGNLGICHHRPLPLADIGTNVSEVKAAEACFHGTRHHPCKGTYQTLGPAELLRQESPKQVAQTHRWRMVVEQPGAGHEFFHP